MTDKHIPASKLLALIDSATDAINLSFASELLVIKVDDLRALIDAEPESVEPVAVIALKNAELNNRVCVLEDLLSSAYAIANRNGSDTHWPRFASQLHINGISPITAKTFKVLPSDVDYSTAPPADNLISEKQATIDRLTSERDRLLELLKYSNQALKDGIEDEHELEAEHSKHARLLCANNDALIAEIEANNG